MFEDAAQEQILGTGSSVPTVFRGLALKRRGAARGGSIPGALTLSPSWGDRDRLGLGHPLLSTASSSSGSGWLAVTSPATVVSMAPTPPWRQKSWEQRCNQGPL